jgi:phosphatidylglycerophosphatase A
VVSSYIIMTPFINFFADLWATFFFVGRAPKAPGTFGSLAALPFAWFLWTLPTWQGWVIVFVVFLLGVAAAANVIARSGVEDHQSIVIDEVVGIFIVTSIAPRVLWAFALAFVLFRAFDIGKPWPISWVDQKWKGGSGAMLDDVVAAAIATLVFKVFLIGLMSAGYLA